MSDGLYQDLISWRVLWAKPLYDVGIGMYSLYVSGCGPKGEMGKPRRGIWFQPFSLVFLFPVAESPGDKYSYIYRNDNKHIDYKPDPRKAHDGTIEFTSIDAHMGCGKYKMQTFQSKVWSVSQKILYWRGIFENECYYKSFFLHSCLDKYLLMIVNG